MSKRLLCYFVVAIASAAAVPRALAEVIDRARLIRGSETGEVTKMTRYEVTFDKGVAGSVPISVNDIKSLVFEGEPTELTQARVQTGNGAFAKAIGLLEKIDLDEVKRDFVKQDIAYYKAYCASRLALSGAGEITDAGRQLNSFVRSNPDSFHALEAAETMGDLLMAAGKYDFAEKQYAEVAKAPWPVYKMRAAVSLGRSLQAQGKNAEAIQQFDTILAMADDTPDAQAQKLSATLGKAISLAETSKGDDAVKIIQKVIQDADPQQKELHARAYNALGNCYEKSKQTKEALFAFLRVDVVYSNVPEAHAEALAHLVPLWKAVGNEEQSREARETLLQKHGSSKWAKQVQ